MPTFQTEQNFAYRKEVNLKYSEVLGCTGTQAVGNLEILICMFSAKCASGFELRFQPPTCHLKN